MDSRPPNVRRVRPAEGPEDGDALGPVGGASVVPSRGVVASAGGEAQGNTFSLPLLLWRRKWSLIAVTLLSLAGGWAYLRATPLTYTCSALFHVQQQGPKLLTDNQGFMVKSDSYLYLQGELIKGPAVLDAAAADPAVASLPAFAGLSPEGRAGRLRGGLRVDLDQTRDTIRVSCTAADPAVAAVAANALVSAYVEASAAGRTKTSGEVLTILQDQKAKLDADLSAHLRKMADYRRANNTLSFGQTDGDNVVLKRLAELSDALTQSQFTLLQAKGALESAKGLADDPTKLSVILASLPPGQGADVGLLSADLSAARANLAYAAAKLRDLTNGGLSSQNRQVVLARGELELARTDMAAAEQSAAANYLAVLARRSADAARRQAELQAAFDAQQGRAQDYNAKAAEYALMDAEVNRIGRLSESLDARIKELRVNTDPNTMNVTRLEAADAGSADVEPARKKVLAMALVLGVTLGGLCVLVQDWADRRIRTPGEMGGRMNLQVLATLPHVRGRPKVGALGSRVADDPHSAYAEAFRNLHASIHFSGARRPKVLLVTSPRAGEGKSATASNLAAATAEAGLRVLLIDADLRRPAQHLVHPPAGGPGLWEALGGHCPAADAIGPTASEGLDVMHHGGPDLAGGDPGAVPGAAPGSRRGRMLTSRSFREVLRQVYEAYDYIVVDAPPLLLTSDALNAAAVSDCTLLVLRAGRSEQADAEAAVTRLQAVQARRVAMVVNDLREPRGGYGYYGPSQPKRRRRLITATDSNGASGTHGTHGTHGTNGHSRP